MNEKYPRFEFGTRIPEDSAAFQDWQHRQETGEESGTVELPEADTPEVQVTLPEDSAAFQDWQQRQQTDQPK